MCISRLIIVSKEGEIERNMAKNVSAAPAGALQENKMGVMPIGKLLFNMALPMIISMLIQALYNVVDSHGNILLSGLADVVSPTVYELPDGIFPARRGFERGYLDLEGNWLYSESVFTSLADEDSAYYG